MSDKIAIVFGGTRGIGAACCAALESDGFRVLRTGTGPDGDAGQGAYAQVDIRNAEAVEAVFAKCRETFGAAPSCVVANAGINRPPAPVADFPDDAFRDLVEVNLVGAFHILRAAANHVADGGTIIGLTTSMVRVAVPGGGPYTATKAAVESLLRSMSRECAGRGVRVNGVAPGPVDTDLFRSGKDDAAVARAAGMSPFDRVGTPEEVAAVVAFLASDAASWVHGQIVQPNGGMV